MSDNIRIKTTPGSRSKNINLKINQKFDFIEILSLKISQAEAYRRFCSDYGVVVGRVIVNNGVGVPNAKVSIFIPIDEVDAEDSEIFGLYPYERITDTNDKGIPYNLLPRNNRGKDECFSPIGTFPSKREIQDNPEMADIYCDYYKFTVTTNESGDFMIFGVPVGTHFMHVDADISDIGVLSQRPYDLIREGTPFGKFTSPTKFKGISETLTLTQLKTTSPTSVTVPPFWGDTEECRIGIARSDINLATNIVPQAIFMGSIISDNDKHAVSKSCSPRRNLGKMDELVTGEGSIEMIRKTNDDKTERYDVEGGELIDEDGAWAYQIPMNRNYMITDEYGNFIPSEDSSKGIPTKAKVRFRIGMNIEGDEGRNRTRAKFLVPHNPDTWKGAKETGTPGTTGYSPFLKGVDFSFDSTTKDEHFTELSWNKIYTVKNHITRAQPTLNDEVRNFIGLKNVDDSKNRNPFPFNKLDNKINPLFTIICIIIRIIARIVGVINFIVIAIINLIMILLNVIMSGICIALYGIGSVVCGIKLAYGKSSCRAPSCIGTFKSSDNSCDCKDIIPYVPYITLGCSADDSGKKYAPGGRRGKTKSSVFRKAWDATYTSVDPETKLETTEDFHYVNDGAPEHECTALKFLSIEGCDAGWSHCQTLALADAFDIFKFDFYNDWINGSLYSFLLKYKIRRNGAGRERFCEVDCRQVANTGVDNNGNGIPDNRCKRNYILDVCTGSQPQFSTSFTASAASNNGALGVNSYDAIKIRSGYIKKNDGELYYSPITRDGDIKLYATDIVNLGSVFDCDWEGEPVFYKYLTDTTFNIPPLVAQYEPTSSGGNGPIQITGFDTPLSTYYSYIPIPQINNGIYNVGVNPANPTVAIIPIATFGILKSGLIGNITCGGLQTNSNNCNNIKRLSELGMGLDERRDDTGSVPNNRIGNEDVESDFVRGMFTYLNSPNLTEIPSVRIDEKDYYDYEDVHYKEFRNVNKRYSIGSQVFFQFNPLLIGIGSIQKTDGQIWFYESSYYFYFGLNKGKTALSKMKSKYFAKCTPEPDIDFFVIATDVTSDLLSNGSGDITIQVSGGVGPYTFFWNGPTIGGLSYPLTPDYTSEPGVNTNSITGLYAGTYTVTVTDSAGNVTDGTFIIPGVPSTYCNIQKTDITANGYTDGEITIDISNGTSPYTVTTYNYDPSPPGTLLSLVEPPTTGNSTSRLISNLGKGYYKVIVTDSSIPQTSCDELIEIIEPQALNVVLTPNDVACNGEKSGSIISYVSGGVGPYSFLWSNGETTSLIDNLYAGTYSVDVTDDGANTTTNLSISVNEPLPITYDTITTVDGNCNGSVASISVNNIGGGSGGPYTTTISTESKTGTDVTFDNSGLGLDEGNGINAYEVTVTDVSGCTKSEFVDVFSPDIPLTAVLNSDTALGTITATIDGGVFNLSIGSGIDIYQYVIEWYKGSSTTPDVVKTLSGSNDVYNLPVANLPIIDSTGSLAFAPPVIYTIKVRDRNGNGCLFSDFVVVPQDYGVSL